MSTSKAITRNDLTSILNDVLPAGSGGGNIDVSDMTSAEVEEFVEDLTPTTAENISAAIADYFTPTEWNNLTLSSQVAGAGTNPINAWRMVGPFVEIRLCFTTSTTHTAWTEIASMPAGKRPVAATRINLQGNTSAVMAAEVNASGTIQIYNATTTNAWWAGSVLYYPEY